LISKLVNSKVFVEIETNGTISPKVSGMSSMQLLAIQWNVSPKFDNINNEVLDEIATYPIGFFKFVVNPNKPEYKQHIQTITDFKDRQEDRGINLWDRIYLMPECKTSNEYNEVATLVYKESKLLGVRFSTRIQVLTNFK
jgi:organic radical activating enzyme